MDHETIAHILHGCKLARDLESTLESNPELASHPHFLLDSCQQIVATLSKAMHGLQNSRGMSPGHDAQMPFGHIDLDDPFGFGAGSGYSIGTRDTDIEAFGAGAGEAHGVAVAGGGVLESRRPPEGGSSVQRSSRKRKEGEGRTVRVPALRTANMDIPPDDGYTWRKYGQKDILGCKFPRSYYRCTHKNFYGCEAKKQVQRLDDDPYVYEVTYCGDHSCRTSPTPLVIPSLPLSQQGEEPLLPESTHPPNRPLSTSIQLGSSWMSREFDSSQTHGDALTLAGSSGTDVASSSQVHIGRDLDCSVTDLADVMFNSGSSGSSMDAIFSSSSKHD